MTTRAGKRGCSIQAGPRVPVPVRCRKKLDNGSGDESAPLALYELERKERMVTNCQFLEHLGIQPVRK